MSWVIFLGITAVVLAFFGFKLNNIRTRLAFFFIFLGLILTTSFGFLVVNGESFDFGTIKNFATLAKVYFVWAKSLMVQVFEITGKIIGIDWTENLLLLPNIK